MNIYYLNTLTNIKNVWYFSCFLCNFVCAQYSSDTFTPWQLLPPNISHIWSKTATICYHFATDHMPDYIPLHNTFTSATFSVPLSSGNCCNICQNINSKPTAATQHKKTTRMVYTCKYNWHLPKLVHTKDLLPRGSLSLLLWKLRETDQVVKGLLHERPFTHEGNYLICLLSTM